MLDDENPTTTETASEAADTLFGAEKQDAAGDTPVAPAKKAPARKTTKKTTRKRAAAKTDPTESADAAGAAPEAVSEAAPAPSDAPAGTSPHEGIDAAGPTEPSATPAKRTAKKAAAKKATAKKTATKKAATKRTAKKAAGEEPVAEANPDSAPAGPAPTEEPSGSTAPAEPTPAPAASPAEPAADAAAAAPGLAVPLFQPPTPAPSRARRGRRKSEPEEAAEPAVEAGGQLDAAENDHEEQAEETGEQGGRRRRRRGGRRRRKSGDSEGQSEQGEPSHAEGAKQDGNRGGKQETKAEGEESESGGSRRRRRRRRSGDDSEPSGDEPENTVTRVRKGRSAEDEITALTGSTRLEAKRQRRREGREAGRRRAPIVSEAEFLARREAVDRVMVMRQRDDLTQIAVLEDNVLVEHYVARESQTSLIGNVYLGRVQNVLPSMEAAFIDIGKGRNAVLYAGEVNWEALGSKDGNRKIEQVLKSGQPVLVQVTKDPIGHKGARLTSQIALPGRFLVYVPDGTTSGISRKLPDTERNRLKTLLKQIVPESAGVIVRTAAEGASEEELTRDVERLTARWSDIAAKVEKGNAPQLLYGEPDLTLKVVRDLFTEDFGKLVVSGDDAWDMVDGYVQHVAPDLADRLEKWSDADKDVFAEYRIDEQIAKGLDRKVWLPSGGSLIIDRTEAMTVIDVNTGKFTGSGGNLEETVTKNNLEAAEEIVRQLRLRDIGGIVVIDFIDMVLESNRDLVLRRLVECLGRDRTRHQVAEVTSLGLVQMTRKRIGTGLLEAFSESCEHCQGRGLLVHHEPIEPKKKAEEEPRRGRRGGGRGRGKESQGNGAAATPSPKDVAAMARPEQPSEDHKAPADDKPAATDHQDAGEVTQQGRPQAEKPEAEKPEAAAGGEPAPGPEKATEKAPEKAPEPVAVPEPAAPKVVTRVRRRSSRPAGPPPGAAAAGAAAGEASDAGAGAHSGPGEATTGEPASAGDNGAADTDRAGGGPEAVGHVPVKTKTGRRR